MRIKRLILASMLALSIFAALVSIVLASIYILSSLFQINVKWENLRCWLPYLAFLSVLAAILKTEEVAKNE